MTTNSSNKDIDYINRDYDSVVDALISYANVNFGSSTSANRLWTDFNADSFSRNWLEIVSFVSDSLYFYLDVQATQSYLQTATVRSAVEDIAKQFGYTTATATSATGDVIFTTSGPLTIPRGFRVQATNGEQFYVTSSITATAAGEIPGTVIQGQENTESFAATGLQNEEFSLSGKGVIRDLTNTVSADISPQVTVNGNSYTLVSSFIRHDGSDTQAVTDSLGNIVGGGGRVFSLEKRRDDSEYIKFGDGVFGRKLTSSDNVIITYRTGGGSAGNVSKNSLVQLVDSLTNLDSVTNPGDFSGGSDEQTIEQLRDLIPASLRTLDRAVAEQDYSDIIVTNFPEVFTASTEKNSSDLGVDINIFVVPQGTGITKITDNSLLTNRINSFVELRKTVTVQFQLLDAYGIDTLITLEVFISDTASKTTVAEEISTVIQEFFDLNLGGTSGAGIGFAENILLKDIGDLVQEVEGVERFEIKRLTYRPRIDHNIKGFLTEYQTSEVNIFPNVSESEWLLAPAGPVGENAGEVLYSNDSLVDFSYDQTTGKISYVSEVDLSQVSSGDTFITGEGSAEVSEITVLPEAVGQLEESKITTLPDVQGVQEITSITTIIGSAITGASYLLLQDLAGSVAVWINVDAANTQPAHGADRSLELGISSSDSGIDVALGLQTLVNSDSAFTATVALEVVTITNNTKANLTNAIDGSTGTGFAISTTQEGVTPDFLSGTYFDIDSNTGINRVWYNVDTGSSAPSAGGNTLQEVSISSNDTAEAVATATEAVLASAGYTTVLVGDLVTATDATDGTRTDISDGIVATGFTLETSVQGANSDSLGGKYWLLNSPHNKGTYHIWYNTGSSVDPSPTESSGGVEVSISGIATAIEVADNSASAIASFNLSEITSITTTNSNTLNGKYFLLHETAGSVAFYYNVAGGTPTPPLNIADRTPVEIVLAANNLSASDVAAATQLVIDAEPTFSAANTPGSDVIAVTGFNSFLEDASPATSGFIISIVQQGVSFLAASDGIDKVTVTNVVSGVTDDTRDGDSSFTFSTPTQGTTHQRPITIQGASNLGNYLYAVRDLVISTTLNGNSEHGNVLKGDTSYDSFKCYKKTLATASNLSVNSITDNNLDLSVLRSTAASISTRVLLDNSKVFIDGQYATGDFLLVDSSNNIWDIVSNTSNTITVGITAVSDAGISTVATGDYKIVTRLLGSEVLFNGTTFAIQYNSANTIFSIGSQLSQIGTIGDPFEISAVQNNLGSLGVAADLVSFNAATKNILLNGNPDLRGVTSSDLLIDSLGQVFNITAIDGRVNSSAQYSATGATSTSVLKGAGDDSQFAQGFKVEDTEVYTTVSLDLKREGNAVGNLVARIVADDGTGLPDVTNLIAISKSLAVTDVSEESEKVLFTFTTPPTLSSGIQYHLVLSGDAGYQTSQETEAVVYSNASLVGYSYTAIDSASGQISYAGSPDLSGVSTNNFFRDSTDTHFKILTVDNVLKLLTIASTTLVVPSEIVAVSADASCYAKDNVHITYDDTTPTYVDGAMTTFDGVSNWTLFGTADAIFSVEGPQSITIDSNLTPQLGEGSTISSRYYDDNNEVSLVLGISNGTIVFATDVNAYGKGTVGGVPNSSVDTFIFRTARYSDDIINVRLNEIPQITAEDIITNIFGGIS